MGIVAQNEEPYIATMCGVSVSRGGGGGGGGGGLEFVVIWGCAIILGTFWSAPGFWVPFWAIPGFLEIIFFGKI